jgi:hypothetical protein
MDIVVERFSIIVAICSILSHKKPISPYLFDKYSKYVFFNAIIGF